MIQEMTLDAPVRCEDDYVEFTARVDGRRQAFRVEAGVFTEMLKVSHIDETRMKNLFMADPEHFLFVAARKLSELGPNSAPIQLTLADLLR
jgi:hypothetical protein